MQYKAVMALAVASAPLARAQTWDTAYSKAKASLALLSLEDKVGLASGVGWLKGPCVGNTHAAAAINFPSLCLQDGPLGVRFSNGSTAFTPAIQAAATWDMDLMRQRGQMLAAEVRAMGVHVSLGPVGGPLGKNAQGGRNWEGFGPDPYLTGVAMAETITAMQGMGIQATGKHFIGNEQEHGRETMSSNIDDRTLHELYAWPFADAIHAGVAAIMCSYNRVNGVYACENEHLMETVLKEQMGFRGYVMSDWNAQHTTVQSANSGLDMTMPGSDFGGNNILWGPQLVSAVRSGQVNVSRVDDMVTRILAGWYLVGQDLPGYPSVNLNQNVQGNHQTNVRSVAADGIVLLKNEGVLPLRPAGRDTVAVVGSAAVRGAHTDNNAAICADKGCDNGALGMGWGSGSVNYPYFVTPWRALSAKPGSKQLMTLSGSDDTAAAAAAASGKDVALVFITADAGEGYIVVEGNAGDRNNLDPWHAGNDLVRAVAAVCTEVVVVVHSVGPVLLEQILALPSVKAVVWAGLPSQESGNALVDVLYGDVTPSGKLVYTIAKTAADYGTSIQPGDDSFSEGLYIDYRHFDEAGIEPRYEFGFGLSYTNWTYSNLAITSNAESGPATGRVGPGGPSDLFDVVATVTVNIENTGSVRGAETAQLYIGYPLTAPRTPRKQLRGFDKVRLGPGAAGTAVFNLRKRDLAYWEVSSQQWVVPHGTFTVSVGASSRDIRERGHLEVA